MKKTYLLTFHRALNYGAVLQCYALYRTISKIGDCEVIDYRSRAIEKRYKLIKRYSSLKDCIRFVISWTKNRAKRKKFDLFLRQNISLTQRFKSITELSKYKWNDGCLFCVGSDQVWNNDITVGDKGYFLEFAPQSNDKISYAASVGTEIDEQYGKYLETKLHDFTAVSVREKSTALKLQTFDVDCTVNIDPVYLLDASEWNIIVERTKNLYKRYILLYLLQKDDELVEAAKNLAKKEQKTLVVISSGIKRLDAVYIDRCDPNEFVGLFARADAIFTNSFHGISFAILFHKLFFFNYQGNQSKTNSRLKDTIELFGLQQQEYKIHNELNKTIDYVRVNSIINAERTKSFNYLKKYIGSYD